MAQRLSRLVLTLLCALLFIFHARADLFSSPAHSTFAPVDQAFNFDFQQNSNRLKLKWQILPGYYLYQHSLKIEPRDARLGEYTLPDGQSHEDEFFGKVTIYTESLSVDIPIQSAEEDSLVTVTYQGCAEAGFCYPPETKTVPLSEILAQASPPPLSEGMSAESAPTESSPLPFSPLWAVLFGIGVALTPCVLPMYPLITGLILGSRQRPSTRRTLLLSLTYVQGMALTYALLGVVVATLGFQFQAALQHPAILIGLSVLFVLLALAMFGVYSLQLPASLQTWLVNYSNRQTQGSLWGVLVMGAIAGLICSPCTTAPLSAILLYIAQSGNLLSGSLTLYLYALGMGIPLIAIILFGRRVLPASGPWMEQVKEGFGFIILAMPIFLIERLLNETWGERLWALWLVSFLGWALLLSLRSSRGSVRVLQILLLICTLVAVRPLQEWVFETQPPVASSALTFQTVTSNEELQQALAEAKGKKVMLDFYADWCVACKEYEKYTFRDPDVQQALSDWVVLQADVTANSHTHQAMFKTWDIRGLPTILFFDETGKELKERRLSGFLNAEAFQQYLDSIQKNRRDLPESEPTKQN